MALTDLFHFFVLFLVVHFSYACVGCILFGHQLEAFSDMSQSALTMFIMLLSFDTTQFFSGVCV